jgi:heme A synthase
MTPKAPTPVAVRLLVLALVVAAAIKILGIRINFDYSQAIVPLAVFVVAMLVLLLFLGSLRSEQAKHHMSASPDPRHRWARSGTDEIPETPEPNHGEGEEEKRERVRRRPFHVMGGEPWLGNISTSTADGAMRFTHRVFRRRRR